MKRAVPGGTASPPSKRRSSRIKVNSGKSVVVDSEARLAAVQQRLGNRLDRLENDNWEEEAILEDDINDTEFKVDDDEEHFPKDPRRKAIKRKNLKEKQIIKSLDDLIEEANLTAIPRSIPTYLTAATALPLSRPPRFFCTVCGQPAPYTCTLCAGFFL